MKWLGTPWWIDEDKNNDGTPWIEVRGRLDADNDITICTMGSSSGDTWGGFRGEREHAHLLKAAPDLHKALVGMIEALSSLDHRGVHRDKIEFALAALTKAQGK